MHAVAGLTRRLLSTGPALRNAFSTDTARALVLHTHGAPETVVQLAESPIPSYASLQENQVLINILAAPINPSDMNTIEGKYPLKPDLPGTPGHEGVGVVAAVGAKVTRMRAGDRVVPIEHSQGTWRSHGVFMDRHWYRIPADLPIATAATMVINPPSALRMLEEYVALQPGDTIIHSGATSSVGKYIIQLAKHKELNTICVIRDRADRQQVARELKDLGASLVVTPAELRSAMKDWTLPPPKLGLDCVAGDTSAELAKALAPGSTLVVYGGMSQQPLVMPPSQLIFRDIRIRGFWLTGGYAAMKDGWKAKEQLVDRVCALFRQKVIKPVPVDCVPLGRWKEAIEMYRENHRDNKILLTNYPEDVDACM